MVIRDVAKMDGPDNTIPFHHYDAPDSSSRADVSWLSSLIVVQMNVRPLDAVQCLYAVVDYLS